MISSAIGFHLPADGLVPVSTPGTFLFPLAAFINERSLFFLTNHAYTNGYKFFVGAWK